MTDSSTASRSTATSARLTRIQVPWRRSVQQDGILTIISRWSLTTPTARSIGLPTLKRASARPTALPALTSQQVLPHLWLSSVRCLSSAVSTFRSRHRLRAHLPLLTTLRLWPMPTEQQRLPCHGQTRQRRLTDRTFLPSQT